MGLLVYRVFVDDVWVVEFVVFVSWIFVFFFDVSKDVVVVRVIWIVF